MNRRGDGFTWVVDILSSGWGETKNGPFKGMKDPQGTSDCLLGYLNTGTFTLDQKERFLQQINTHYRKWCFSISRPIVEPPQSLNKYFKKGD